MPARESVLRVSVVVFVHVGHSKFRETLASLGRQTRFDEIEVILADGRPKSEDEELARDFPWVRRISMPGSNMPWLKGAAVQAARGDIIAILDPWGAAPTDWIDQILLVLEDPGVSGAGGSVVMDGPLTTINRAAFLFEYGPFNPPLSPGPTDADLAGNNLALRRAALVDYCGDILEAEGFNKPFCLDALRAHGAVLTMAPEMTVRHLTAHRFAPFFVRHFHHARCFGATRRRLSTWPRMLLFCTFAPAVPFLLMQRHVRQARRHPANRRLVKGALPALLGICVAWGLGEWTGYWFGAGPGLFNARYLRRV